MLQPIEFLDCIGSVNLSHNYESPDVDFSQCFLFELR